MPFFEAKMISIPSESATRATERMALRLIPRSLSGFESA